MDTFKLEMFLLLMLAGCVGNQMENTIKKTVNLYISSNEIVEGAHIEVREYQHGELQIFRIMANITYDEEILPSEVLKQEGRYVLLYLKNDSRVDFDNLPKAIIEREKKYERSGIVEFYTPVEWLVLICPSNKKHQVIKDTGYAPLDSLKRVQEFKCK